MGKVKIKKTSGKKQRSNNERPSQGDHRSSKEFRLTDKLSRLFYSWVRRKRTSVYQSPIKITFEHYEIKGMICQGTFGQVYSARNLITNLTAAAKIERKDCKFPQLSFEFSIYEMLGCDRPGFIKVYQYGSCENYNILIMELLGPDLDDLFCACNEIFTHKTVLMITLQTIALLEYIHSKKIIYRDIKPENFCIGHRYRKKENVIYVIDFGLAKIVDNTQISSQKEETTRHNYLIGTTRYMSIAAHYGREQSKRDDLESLYYMYSYFLKGELPWMGLSRNHAIMEHINEIALLKENATADELFPEYPEFRDFMNYINTLKHKEEPNYEYIKGVFQHAFETNNYNNDKDFDWTTIMNKRYLHKAIDVDPDD